MNAAELAMAAPSVYTSENKHMKQVCIYASFLFLCFLEAETANRVTSPDVMLCR